MASVIHPPSFPSTSPPDPTQNGQPSVPPPGLRTQTLKHLVQSSVYPFNELADEYFYNVSKTDAQAVHAWAKRAGTVIAGSIVYVAPGKDPKFFADVYEFLSPSKDDGERAREEVRGLCVPGVGSSVLGAVGLARDVCIARGIPVAGVVAGYGLRELLNEAVGGALYFRETNQLEFALENTRRGLSSLVAGLGLLPMIETVDSLGGGPTIQSVKALLRDGRLPHLEFLVGHSKGNMVLSGALGELFCEKAPITQLDQVTIVLLSAICALPKVGKKQVQIIGALDPLGWANSRLGVAHKVVLNAAHHLNKEIPLYLDAVAELKAI
ncbi:hypothetical protein [Occallatibacter riparius]|uniref:Uncharacterized protein n=1 Tax=Occallatibacter riparius TaxID=1002689 RepID=A0A9J7BLR3_9BACT|nr:hypothetical protein [Occallatibacter riparius]UWZ82157.1 hypothetical protein MOP44_16425 [Occallatibacter riparius]